MIEITIPETEFFDESTSSFVMVKGYTLKLEHSLLSVSKWESKWKKPFLTDKKKTDAEAIDYIRCMTLTQGIPEEAYLAIPTSELTRIADYINDPMTATTFSDNLPRSSQIITSELIYYNMVAAGVPFECQKWHLNRLLTLLRICGIKSQPSKKMSVNQIRSQNAALNAARRAKTGSRG